MDCGLFEEHATGVMCMGRNVIQIVFGPDSPCNDAVLSDFKTCGACECHVAHEEQHISDVLSRGGDLSMCPKGCCLGWGQDFTPWYECRAYSTSLNCMMGKLIEAMVDGNMCCVSVIEEAIFDVVNRLRAYGCAAH